MNTYPRTGNGEKAAPALMAPSGPRQEQITPRELYVLRRAALEVERRRLALQRTEQQLQGFLLRLELRYGLLGSEAELDLRNGRIRRPQGSC